MALPENQPLPSNDQGEEELHCARRCLNTPDGQVLIHLLQESFSPDHLVGDGTHQTYFNLGRRDVVKYLEYVAATEPKAQEYRH